MSMSVYAGPGLVWIFFQSTASNFALGYTSPSDNHALVEAFRSGILARYHLYATSALGTPLLRVSTMKLPCSLFLRQSS